MTAKEKIRTTKHTIQVKAMIMKIDHCLHRLLRDKADSTTIQCSGETIHLQMEGLI